MTDNFQKGDFVFIVSNGVPQKHIIAEVVDYDGSNKVTVKYHGGRYELLKDNVTKMSEGDLLLYKLEKQYGEEWL